MVERALSQQSRQLQQQRISELWRKIFILFAGVLVIVVIVLLVLDYAYRSPRFVVKNVHTQSDSKHVSSTQLMNAIRFVFEKNIFSVDLNNIKHTLEKMPWVRRSQISRQWPNALNIHVAEHKPLMKWGTLYSSKWVNQYGEVVNLPMDTVKSAILLKGDERLSVEIFTQATHWKPLLLIKGFDLISLAYSGAKTWEFSMKNIHDGEVVNVVLPHKLLTQKMQRALDVIAHHRVIKPHSKITRLDARYPNGVSVKTITRTQTKTEGEIK